jgi:uncharacterized oxidoreductase
MNMQGNTILITGGATGIGYALAEAFTKAGNKVLICGRRKNRLEGARNKIKQLEIMACDVSDAKGRKALFEWATRQHPDINILVNNAGIQRWTNVLEGPNEMLEEQDEINTNLAAPIHLSAYFAPFFEKRQQAAIFNVSSGLGFVPIAGMAVYCATKAALHSFTVSLRYQLKDTGVKVFEIIPPAVNTELGKNGSDGSPDDYPGIEPSELATAVIKAARKDQYEIAVGEAADLVSGSRHNFEKAFLDLNQW